MDTTRFDRLTRDLATAKSRRGVLKLLIGGGAAVGAAAAFAPSSRAAGTVPAGGTCAVNDDCIQGYYCNFDLICASAPECSNAGGGCDADEACCGDLICGNDRKCAVDTAECAVDDDCTGDEICCGGTCAAIQCCIDDEDPNARCPEGTSCFEGVCDPVGGGECSADSDCATDEICCGGTCAPIACCIDDEDPNARCPDGTSCFEGVCDPLCTDAACPAGTCCCGTGAQAGCDASCCAPVGGGTTGNAGNGTTLPATGSGARESGASTWVVGAAVLGGAAAVGASRLRGSKDVAS